MQDSSVPSKIQIPWANSAGSANIRTVPLASQLGIQPGAASFTDGFVPLNFVPVTAGGVPPFGQDFNGILQIVTQWLQWGNAGGAVRYDAGFVSAVGGYPIGATLMSNSGHAIFESLIDNNSGDPNAGAVNWRILSSVWSLAPWQASGSANIQTVTLSPAPTSSSQLSGIPITLLSQGTNTGAVTLNVNGLGALPVVTTGGSQIGGNVLVTSYPFTVILAGSAFVLMSSGGKTGRGFAQFSTPGTHSFLWPLGVPTIKSRLWGAGGSAGGVNGNAQSSGASAGGYSEKLITGVPGTVYTVIIGAGPVGGNGTPTDGTTGGTTSFGTFHSATGGGPGFSSSSGGQPTTSAGGIGIGGDINLQGTTGSGSITNGGGSGGGSPFGIAGAPAGSIGGPGSAGFQPGGGGGGTAGTSGGFPGGKGGDGLALFDW